MKLKILWCVPVLILGFCYGYIVWKSDSSQGPALQGKAAPDFRFARPSGRMASLADFRGKVVLISFWATWCPPCQEEMPSMERLSRAMDANRLVILPFSVDRSWGPVKRFMADNAFSMPVYADFDRNISTLYGTSKFPETYIIDKKGVVAFKVIGAIDWMAPEMLSFLNQLQAASK